MSTIDNPGRHLPRYLVYLLLPLLLGVMGYLAFEYEKSAIQTHISQQLIAISDLKLMEISRWITVWKRNANAVARHSLLSDAFSRYLDQGKRDGEAKEQLLAVMRQVDSIFQTLGTSIFDVDGKLVLSTDPTMEAEATDQKHEIQLREILNLGQVLMSPLHLAIFSGSSKPHFEVFAPLTRLENHREWRMGILAITVDPEEYLFPLIRKWPTPNKSAETLLVEKEGNNVVYLNDLRFQPKANLRLRLPLDRPDLPAALGIKGIEGVVEGVDYRGARVIAAVRAVPGTPWYVEAKVDKEELYAPIRRWQIATIIAVVILAMLMITAFHLLRTREARQRAERATKAKSEFLANMSHEIRTPLNAIIGFAETLRDADNSEEDRGRIGETILRNSKYLMDVVNDILDLSKIEAERIEVEIVPTNAVRLVQDVSELMRQRASEKGVVFRQEFVFPLPEQVLTDGTRLKQILLNLVSNAIKFTEKGFVCLKVGIRAGEEKMWFEVSDTGQGMTPEEVSRVFEPFYQGVSNTRGTAVGTGLGLTISKRLARLLGGDLTIESEKGKGTKCTLSIDTGRLGLMPFIHEVLETDHIHEQSGQKTAAPSLQGRVLLMEDNIDTQQLMSYLIKKTGAEAVVVGNGRLGVEVGLREQFDLLIVDMHMPEMDGATAVRTLKERGVSAPMVVLSADAVADRMKRCLEIGCDDYFIKPFERRTFYKLLERYLKTKAFRAPAPSEISQDDPEYREIVESFEKKLPVRVAELAECLYAGHFSEVEAGAHRLASAALFGYPRIGQVAQKLQKAAADKNRKSAIELLEQLKKACVVNI